MEHGIGKFLLVHVLLFQIRVHVREVDGFADIRLIIAAIRVDQRRNEMHAVEIAQQDTVFPVAEATLLLFHKNKSHTLNSADLAGRIAIRYQISTEKATLNQEKQWKWRASETCVFVTRTGDGNEKMNL